MMERTKKEGGFRSESRVQSARTQAERPLSTAAGLGHRPANSDAGFILTGNGKEENVNEFQADQVCIILRLVSSTYWLPKF